MRKDFNAFTQAPLTFYYNSTIQQFHMTLGTLYFQLKMVNKDNDNVLNEWEDTFLCMTTLSWSQIHNQYFLQSVLIKCKESGWSPNKHLKRITEYQGLFTWGAVFICRSFPVKNGTIFGQIKFNLCYQSGTYWPLNFKFFPHFIVQPDISLEAYLWVRD